MVGEVMSDHMPECEPRIRLMGFDSDGDETCFTCRALRACEERVRGDLGSLSIVASVNYEAGCRDGRAAALAEARDAVP
jgi:hypothetical protein